tara:strand:- start:839 stop:1525 length:687 start_codon:yes stop_codon:yes gene_type:complete
MKSLAIIPARGGSKRFPKKNIVKFKNHPIISYTIEAAIKSNCFEKVVVSSEDDEIKKISKKYGAEIHNRPLKLAGDKTKVAEVLIDCLKFYERQKEKFDVICCLFPTSPLRDYKDIKSVMKIMNSNNCEYVMAITKMPYPAWQSLKEKKKNVFQPVWPELIDSSSQRMGDFYIDNGSTYAIKVESLKKNKSLNGNKIMGHKMSYMKSVDIDYFEDFELANLFYDYLNK